MNSIYFNEVIADLIKITNMKECEIIHFVRSNVISYNNLKEFYLRERRLPTAKECKYIYLLNKTAK